MSDSKFGRAVRVFFALAGSVLILFLLAREYPSGSLATATEPDMQWWRTDIRAAITEGGERKKPIIIAFMAEWCGICREMDRTTFSDADLKMWLQENAILARVDWTNGGQEPARSLLSQYGVSAFPTFVVIGADGVEMKKHRMVGFRTAKEFRKKVEKFR